MQKTAVEKRLKALEAMQDDRLGKTIVVFQMENGEVHHDADVYPDIDAAQAANPGYNTWVIVQVEDMSKP
jgi:hypothetical protein